MLPAEDPLLAAFRRGEATEIVHTATVIRKVVRFEGCGIPASAEPDIVQDSMLDLWRAVMEPGFSLRGSFHSFVRTIAYRRCVDWIRRQRPHAPIDPEQPSAAVAPDEALLESEDQALGRKVLAALPEPCRELIRLRAVACLAYRQIASIRGRTEGALRTQMWECLKEAKRLLERLRGERPSPLPDRRVTP